MLGTLTSASETGIAAADMIKLGSPSTYEPETKDRSSQGEERDHSKDPICILKIHRRIHQSIQWWPMGKNQMKVISPKEAGVLLSLSREAVAKRCSEGAFPNAYLDAGRWKIPMEDISRYQAERRRNMLPMPHQTAQTRTKPHSQEA